MNITIQVTGLGDLADSINNLAEALRAGVKADEVIKTASRKAKRTEQAAQPAPAPEPEALPKEAPAPEPVDTPPAVEETKPAETTTATESPSKPDHAAAKAALLELVKAKGHPAGSEVLKQFGAARISDVKDTDIEAFIAAVAKAQACASTPS